MSKILDILKQDGAKKENDYIQEQLAEIYISPTKKKELAVAKGKRNPNRPNALWLGAGLALGLILLASLVLLFSIKRIDVDITVIRDQRVGEAASVLPDMEAQIPLSGLAGLPDNTVSFNGSAGMESKLTERYLSLVNSRGPGWANIQIEFNKPLDAADSVLSFSARGRRGGENLLVILKDTNNKTYQSINIAPNGLDENWRNFKIRLNKTARWIDARSVSQIKLEFGSITADNPVASTIYIKDFSLNKERRI